MNAPATPPGAAQRGVLLTAVLCLVYFAFIGLVAFAPRLMARPMIGVVSFGLVAAFAVICIALALTALYVWLGNRTEQS